MTAGAPKIPTLPPMPDLKGLCFTHPNPDLWSPDSYKSAEGQNAAEEAIAICSACPVRQACLDAILRREGGKPAKNREGIWGGQTPHQRYNTVKRRQQQRRRNLAAAA